MLIKEILHDQVRIFQGTSFASSQIHQLTIMYCFEHTSHDILLIFLFQKLCKLFLCVCNLYQKYLSYLSDCENLIFRVRKLH